MKTFTWIFSLNSDGIAPFGYGHTMPYTQAELFQNNLKKSLSSEIDLEFISYNINSKIIPDSDLIIYNDLDARFLDEEIKNNSLVVPFSDVFSMNIERIKELLVDNLI